MGLNRFISLSRNSVLPEINTKSSAKLNKNSSKSDEKSKNKKKSQETQSCDETQKIDKTLKNGKSATTTKKSMLWNLRITNKSKISMKKGMKNQ